MLPPADPAFARLIAERVLAHEGVYRASVGRLHALAVEHLPDTPAAVGPKETADAVRRAAVELGRYGIAMRREVSTSGSRLWAFRLIVTPTP